MKRVIVTESGTFKGDHVARTFSVVIYDDATEYPRQISRASAPILKRSLEEACTQLSWDWWQSSESKELVNMLYNVFEFDSDGTNCQLIKSASTTPFSYLDRRVALIEKKEVHQYVELGKISDREPVELSSKMIVPDFPLSLRRDSFPIIEISMGGSQTYSNNDPLVLGPLAVAQILDAISVSILDGRGECFIDRIMSIKPIELSLPWLDEFGEEPNRFNCSSAYGKNDHNLYYGKSFLSGGLTRISKITCPALMSPTNAQTSFGSFRYVEQFIDVAPSHLLDSNTLIGTPDLYHISSGGITAAAFSHMVCLDLQQLVDRVTLSVPATYQILEGRAVPGYWWILDGIDTLQTVVI